MKALKKELRKRGIGNYEGVKAYDYGKHTKRKERQKEKAEKEFRERMKKHESTA